MYLPIVDKASCRLLIMLGDGLRCKVLGDEVFSQRIDPTLLQEIFQTPFSQTERERRQDRFSTVDRQKEREDKTDSAHWTDRKRRQDRFSSGQADSK